MDNILVAVPDLCTALLQGWTQSRCAVQSVVTGPAVSTPELRSSPRTSPWASRSPVEVLEVEVVEETAWKRGCL